MYPSSAPWKLRSSQNSRKRSGRPATWSTIIGRSTRSFFSTSIRRSPCFEYLLSSPFTSDDLPVPRAPVSSTLFAGLPSMNWRVFCSTRSICLSMPRRSESLIRCTWRTGCSQPEAPRRPALRQRKAMLAFQSVAGGGGGRSCSSRFRICSSSLLTLRLRSVLGVDSHVIEREVASPHRRVGLAAVEHHAHGEFGLAHCGYPLLVPIGGMASTILRHQHLIKVEVDLLGVHVGARVADRGENAAEIRIGGEERGLDQRRVRDRVRHLAAFLDALAALHAHGDELGRTFAVAHDSLREIPCHIGDRRLDLQGVALRRDRRAESGGHD